MQDKRGSEPMLVCCVVFLRWTPLLCCDTIDVMKDDNNIVHRWKHAFGRVFLTFVSTWLHCTRIGSLWSRLREKQMPENNSLIMWSPFKVIFFSQKWEEIWQNRWFFSSMVWWVGDEISLTVRFASYLKKCIELVSRFLAKYWSKKDGSYFKRGAHHSSSRVINCVTWKYYVR